jgi:DNA repair exonuclease SbcCD nuclease subunit
LRYAKALDQVADVAKDQKVDAALIAGDVFDSPAPPPEAEKLVYNFLAKLVLREWIYPVRDFLKLSDASRSAVFTNLDVAFDGCCRWSPTGRRTAPGRI